MNEQVTTRTRSWLFTPATRPERFAKGAETGADVLLIDLEDAVAPRDKAAARTTALDYLAGLRAGTLRALRINGLDTRAGIATSMRCSDRLHLRTSWSCPRRKLPAICKSSIA